MLGVANRWLSADLKGKARNGGRTTGPRVPAEENNRIRESMIRALHESAFTGAVDLEEPVLNSHTVMVVRANAARAEMTVEAFDPLPGAVIPRVVARGEVRHQA